MITITTLLDHQTTPTEQRTSHQPPHLDRASDHRSPGGRITVSSEHPGRFRSTVQRVLLWLAVSGPTDSGRRYLHGPQGSPLWAEGVQPPR